MCRDDELKKRKKSCQSETGGRGKAIICIYFLSNEEKQSSSGKNWASMLMASVATLFSTVVFQRHWSLRQRCPSFNLKKVDETNHNWQKMLQLGAWQQITTYYYCVFGRVVMKTAPENAVPWCRLLTPASVTRRKTSRSGINTLKIILCSRRQRGAERAAQKNTVDRPQRPWNTTDPRTINTPLAINHLQVFILRRSVRTPPRIHLATRPEETFSFLPHNTEETFRRKCSIECQSRKSSWEKSLKTEIV